MLAAGGDRKEKTTKKTVFIMRTIFPFFKVQIKIYGRNYDWE